MARKRLSALVDQRVDLPQKSGPGSRSDAAQRPGANTLGPNGKLPPHKRRRPKPDFSGPNPWGQYPKGQAPIRRA